MRKIVFGTSLLIALVAVGCTNSQLHQSLLMHENRRLEDALYVAHARVTDLQQENDSLRRQQADEPTRPPRQSDMWEDDLDTFPSFEMPSVLLPGEPGTTEVPAVLRGSQTIPIWTPRR